MAMASFRLKPRRAFVLTCAILVAIAVGVSVYWMSSGIITSGPCNLGIETPPIHMTTHSGSGELVFVSYRNYTFLDDLPVTALTYELASYPQGTDLRGPGNVTRSGSLSSLNTTGGLQFHDMEAEDYFSPGNDFFILVSPPPVLVQLRILRSGSLIASNPVLQCG